MKQQPTSKDVLTKSFCTFKINGLLSSFLKNLPNHDRNKHNLYLLKRSLLGLVAFTLLSAYSTASMAITNPTTLTFQGMALPPEQGGSAAYYGKANVPSKCAGPGYCYEENGFLLGTIYDPDFGGDFTHLHISDDNPSNIAVLHHADSAGFYITAKDLSAFSLDSIHFDASVTPSNPNSAGQWEILGFSEAYNPNLHSWQWPDDKQPKYKNGDARVYSGTGAFPTQVAYHTVANGFNGTVVLPDQFKNIKAFWIHYKGYPNTPLNAKVAKWNVFLDDVQLSAPILPEPPKLCPY